LFDNVPELGQAWLDHLRASGTPDRFLAAGKHAEGTSSDMPDFLIRGIREDVICEHKLGAPLGPMQLERYLEFARRRERWTRLALITGSLTEVPPSVLAAADYLKPAGADRPYFRWEELYPIVAARSERLAQEFTSYMEQLGLRPCDTREWSDLFTNSDRVADFAPQWSEVIEHFRRLGAGIVHYTVKAPAVLIKDARPWLFQFYLKPVPRALAAVDTMPGPYITALVAVDPNSGLRPAFDAPETLLYDAAMPVLSRPVLPDVVGSRGAGWCREYLARLDDVVSADQSIMRDKLLQFAVTAFSDVISLGGELPPPYEAV
jgi:hypothetical protein